MLILHLGGIWQANFKAVRTLNFAGEMSERWVFAEKQASVLQVFTESSLPFPCN